MPNPDFNQTINPYTNGENGVDFQNNWLAYAGTSPYKYNLIDDIANPYLSQYLEWSQQMTSQMYQNWWNSAPNMMQLGIDAGINPYLMANGIAGTTAPAMSAPNSAVGNGMRSLSALGSAVSGIGSALSGNLGAAVKSFTDLYKLKHEVNNLDSDTMKNLTDLGFTSLQAKAISIQLKYLDDKEQIGVWQALASYDKTKQEYSNLLAQHNNILAQYDEIIARKDLLIAQEGEVTALEKVHQAEEAKVKAVAQWQLIENKFFETHGYKLGSPIYEGIRDSIVNGSDFDPMSYGNVIGTYQGNLDAINYNAQAHASWLSRPKTAYEMSMYVGASLGSNLRNVLTNSSSWSQLSANLKRSGNHEAEQEFYDAYDDAKQELYSNYRHARRAYRSIKNADVSDSVKNQYLKDMNKAKQEYDNFTPEKFSNSLIKSLGSPSNTNFK